MILTVEVAMRNVFTIYAAFWLVVLIALFLGVGWLSRRRERALARQQHGDPGSH